MAPPNLRAASAYNSIGVQTRVMQPSQYDLAALMFDVTLESLTRAQGAIQQGNVAEKVRLLGKAIRILEEGLRTSLDMQNGGELAENLNALYDYCVIKLTMANANSDADLVGEVIALLTPVSEAWKSIAPNQSDQGGLDDAAGKPDPAPRSANVYGGGGTFRTAMFAT